MATRAQIARLQQRIEQTVAAFGDQTPGKVVQIVYDPIEETEEAALKRHLAAYPEDQAHIERRSRFPTLIVVRIIRPKDYGTDGYAISNHQIEADPTSVRGNPGAVAGPSLAESHLQWPSAVTINERSKSLGSIGQVGRIQRWQGGAVALHSHAIGFEEIENNRRLDGEVDVLRNIADLLDHKRRVELPYDDTHHSAGLIHDGATAVSRMHGRGHL